MAPVRVVLYLRYSDEMQSASSIEDQERVCRQYAKKHGWIVVDVYKDAAIRAGAIASRTGWRQLLEAAKRQEFDVVLIEESARFSRVFLDSWKIVGELTDAKVRLADTKNGLMDLSTPAGRVMATLAFSGSQEETERLGERCKRGQQGKVEKGGSSGGTPAYGLMRKPIFSETEVDVDGRPVRDMVIWIRHPTTAPVLQLIFRLYDEGWPKGRIARHLNERSIPSRDAGKMRKNKRGIKVEVSGTWTTASIGGVLGNEVYVGSRDWNKNSRLGERLPRSGKKRLVKNDPSKWVFVPDYCEPLIDNALWDRVQVRLKTDAEEYRKRRTANVRKRYLLSGFLLCGSCGHSFAIGSRGRRNYLPYRCGYRAQRGAHLCDNKVNISQPGIEKRVKDTLDAIVKDPSRLQDLVAEHNRNVTRLNQGQLAVIEGLEAQRDELLKQQTRYADAVGHGSKSPQILTERLQQVEAEIEAIDERIGTARAEIKPLMAPQLRTVQEFASGNASIFTGDFHRDRQFLETVLDGIIIHADGSVVIRFHEENLFAPIAGVVVPEETGDIAQARHRHREAHRREYRREIGLSKMLEFETGHAREIGRATVFEGNDQQLHYIFGEPGEPGQARAGTPQTGEPRFGTVGDPNGISTVPKPRISALYIGKAREINKAA